MKESYNKKEKIIFGGIVIISFITILGYNILTPLMSDDLLFDKTLYNSFMDVLREEYHQYLTWNGRSVLQIILKIFSIFPKWVFNICNSFCFVAFTLLVYCNIEGKKKYDCFLYVLINLFVWNFCIDFSQTILWVGGACNYLWGITIILGFITLYRYLIKNKDKAEKNKILTAAIFIPGVLAGWGNENTSGGAILLILSWTILYVLKNRKVEKWMISGISGMLAGFGFLLLAPGNAVRGAIVKEAESYTGVAAYISRGLKVLQSMEKYFMVYIIIICLLGAYFYYKKYVLEQFVETAIFAFAAVATAGVLIFTPEPMPRAYFGANIYMMIAALQMIQMIRQEDTLLISLKHGGIIAATIWMFFVYVEEGANLTRILREVNEREAYIIEQTEAGNYDLTLPMLRPQFKTKYSFMHESDISDDGENWNNEVYCIRYGLNGITAVPREEWTEY